MEKVVFQYAEDIKGGVMTKLTLGGALERYGVTLIIAETGAIATKGSGPDEEVRVIDGWTNGVYLNDEIRIRDQVRFPTAPDIKALMAETHDEGGTHFQLLFDVSKAHRRITVLEEEWVDKPAR